MESPSGRFQEVSDNGGSDNRGLTVVIIAGLDIFVTLPSCPLRPRRRVLTFDLIQRPVLGDEFEATVRNQCLKENIMS